MNISKIKQTALKYLGYQGQTLSKDFETLMDECLKEIDALHSFRVIHTSYTLSHHPLMLDGVSLDYGDLNTLFENCHEVILIACTLGKAVDMKSKYYSHVNMTKMTVFDAIASSYLEDCCDEYEKFITGKRTFRFCPGYGNVPIELNHELGKRLNVYKHIGLTIQDSHILLPQKSMIGLIGIGDNSQKKSCKNCINIKTCQYRKRGVTCYSTD